MQQKHFISHPDLTKHATHGPESNYYKRATVNDRKRKSSCIHVLCDDLVLFRLRSKELSPVCTGTAFFFLSIAIGVKTSSKKTSIGRTERNTPKHDLASFCAQWTQKRGPKPLQKLRGAANLQSKNLDSCCRNKIRMRSLVPRERNYFIGTLVTYSCSVSLSLYFMFIEFQFTAFNDYSTIDVKGIEKAILHLPV